MEKTPTEYGKRVIKAMEHAGFNQPQLVDAMKAIDGRSVTQSTVHYAIFTAKRTPTSNSAIARACGVNTDWLATGEGSMLEQASGVDFESLKPRNVDAREWVLLDSMMDQITDEKKQALLESFKVMVGVARGS